jgi:hypothetical protein
VRPRKPYHLIVSIDEEMSIRQSDVHPENPSISFKSLSGEKTISVSDVQPWKPEFTITSTDEGISIRQSDVQH